MARESGYAFGKSDVYGITLILGLFGFVFATGDVEQGNVTDQPASSTKTTRGDLIVGGRYPSSDDTISYSTGLWGDPWQREKEKEENPEENSDGSNSELPADQVVSVGDLLMDTCFPPNATDSETSVSSPLVVIPIIVNGDVDNESRLSRIQRRHAVELALSTYGYRMRFPSRMTYKDCAIDYHLTRFKSVRSIFRVPIKFYHHQQSDSFALVLWIKEEFLGSRPLRALGQLVHQVCDLDDQENSKIGQSKLAICGPSFSETLTGMLADRDEKTAELFTSWSDIQLFNPSCTSPSLDKPENRTLIPGKQPEIKIPIHHFIGNDARLAELLKDELDRRGIGDSTQSRIALFVEQGPHEFIDELQEQFQPKDGKLLLIPYLKGIGNKDEQVADYLSRTLEEVKKRLPDGTLQTDEIHAVGIFGSVTDDKLAIARAARNTFPIATFFTTDLDSSLYSSPACRNMIVASHFGLGVEGDLFAVELGSLPSFRDQYQVATFLAVGTIANQMIQNRDEFKVREADTRQDVTDLWKRRSPEEARFQPLAPVLFEIGRYGPVQLTRPDLESSKSGAIAHRPGRRTVRLGAILFVSLLAFAATLLLSCVLATDSRYVKKQLKAIVGRARGVGRITKTLARTLGVVFATRSKLSIFDIRTAEPKDEETGGLNLRWQMAVSDSLTFVWMLTTILFGLLLAVEAVAGDRSNGEPLSFIDGISIWPPVLILYLVSSVGLLRLVREIRPLLNELKNPQKRRTLYNGIAISTVFLVAIFTYVFAFSELGMPPARSKTARTSANATLITACTTLICLAAMSSAKILRARGAISSRETKFLCRFEKEFRRVETAEELNVFRDGYEILRRAMDSGTRASRKLLVPAFLTIFYAAARFPLLDSWQMHPSSYLIVFVPLVVSVIAAWAMRQKSQHFKREAIKRIDRYVGRELKRGKNENVETAGEYRKLILQLNQGPFGPISADPLLGGVLLVITASITGPFRELATQAIGMILRV